MTTSSFLNGSYFTGSAGTSTLTQNGAVSNTAIYNSDYKEQQYNYYQAAEKYSLAESGQEAIVDTSVSNIATYLADGREDTALKAYNDLLEQMSSLETYSMLITESGDDSQLRAVARQKIEEEIGGDLAEFLRANTRDAAGVQKQQILYGEDMCDSTTQEQLLLEMCNVEEEESKLNSCQVAATKVLNVINPANWNWAPWFSTKKIS